MSKNHYTTLEVPETASGDEIKKAFRRLSLKYHPDKNPGKTDTVEMFQKINEAYEILGDSAKKQEYDMVGKNPFMHGPAGFNNVDELFSNIFFGQMQHPMSHVNQGNPFAAMFPPGMFPPGAQNIRIFHNGMPVNMGMEKPAPIIKTVTINMAQVLNGDKVPVEVERWIVENGIKVSEMVTLYVDIFKGIDQNEVIILKDEGNTLNQHCKGDIKVFVKIENTSSFVRNGLDLILEHTITLKEALCGFTYELKHLNGRIYNINNNAGNVVTPEFKKVIPEMGLMRDQHVGNLILHFHIEFPKSLTSEQMAKLEAIL
jgi:DnaJ-class molecular chaperone